MAGMSGRAPEGVGIVTVTCGLQASLRPGQEPDSLLRSSGLLREQDGAASEKEDEHVEDASAVEELRTGTGRLRRDGAWRVPQRMKVVSVTGAIKLDFSEAQLPQGAIEIELKSGTGAVRLILPEGATADISRFQPALGSFHSWVPSEQVPGHPHFVLHGVAGTGRVRVGYPGWRMRF